MPPKLKLERSRVGIRVLRQDSGLRARLSRAPVAICTVASRRRRQSHEKCRPRRTFVLFPCCYSRVSDCTFRQISELCNGSICPLSDECAALDLTRSRIQVEGRSDVSPAI